MKYGLKLRELAERMQFEVVYRASDYDEIEIHSYNFNRPGLPLAGFYEYFSPSYVQLIGMIETGYLNSFPHEEKLKKIETLLSKKVPAVIICHDAEILPEYAEAAAKYDVTIFKTETDTSELLSTMIALVKSYLAPRVTMHGVFVEVYGEGLLLTGDSGVGKSEAAVELIKRGHRLVADDAVEIKRVASNTLVGSAPELIRYYIELRGIGIIDVRRTFGVGAIKLSEKIDLVIHIEPWAENKGYDRLGVDEQYTNILGVDVPYRTLPVTPGRNLAVILEVAAMNNKQKRMGHNSAQEFADKVDRYLEQEPQEGGKPLADAILNDSVLFAELKNFRE